MTDEFKKQLEFFCFDVLGEHTEPDNIEIKQYGKDIWVIIKRLGLICSSKEIMQEDWDREVADRPEFKDVILGFPRD